MDVAYFFKGVKRKLKEKKTSRKFSWMGKGYKRKRNKKIDMGSTLQFSRQSWIENGQKLKFWIVWSRNTLLILGKYIKFEGKIVI